MSFREHLDVLGVADSTNRVLLEKELTSASFGSSVLALEQSSGRGRAGRVWHSGPGGLYISTLLSPSYPEGLALLGAISVIQVLKREFGLKPILRWPNDVLVRGRKIAGVLPAARYRGSRLERAVLGTGLNVCQAMAQLTVEGDLATTVAREIEPEPCPEVIEVARLYLDRLESNFRELEEEGVRALADRCEPYLEGLGSNKLAVVVDDLDRSERELGRIVGLGSLGELRLDNGDVFSALGPSERLRLR